MLWSTCAACGKKKSILQKIKNTTILMVNLTWIINTFLLTGDQFKPELHLKQLGFTNATSWKNSKTGNLKRLYRNELDKACFTHDAAYSDSKDLAKELFQIGFWKIELMKLLEIVNMINIKEHQQLWDFFIRKEDWE